MALKCVIFFSQFTDDEKHNMEKNILQFCLIIHLIKNCADEFAAQLIYAQAIHVQ